MKKIVIVCSDLHRNRTCDEDCINLMERAMLSLGMTGKKYERVFSWYGEPVRIKVDKDTANF